jgi:hypothetical protein
MSKQAPRLGRLASLTRDVISWARHFAAESAGPIAVYLIIPTVTLIAILLIGCFINDAPIIPVCLVGALLSAVISLIIVRSYRVLRRTRQADRASSSISKTSSALILELSGSYTPYVIEAADKLGCSHEQAVTPALLLVLERVVTEQRASWEDIAAAIIEALGNLGDPMALSVLESLRDVKEMRHLPSLSVAIDQLTEALSHAHLLRPVDYDPTAKSVLLRPATELDADGRANLLRATEPLKP